MCFYFSHKIASNCNLTPSSSSPAYMDLMNGLDSESPAADTKCNTELLNLETSQPLTVDSISSAYASAEVFLKPQTNKSKYKKNYYYSSQPR